MMSAALVSAGQIMSRGPFSEADLFQSCGPLHCPEIMTTHSPVVSAQPPAALPEPGHIENDTPPTRQDNVGLSFAIPLLSMWKLMTTASNGGNPQMLPTSWQLLFHRAVVLLHKQ